MQCPKCNSEVQDWHFYCQVCHALVNDPDFHGHAKRQGMVERVGEQVLNVLLLIFVAGVLVLVARSIRWNEFFTAIREEAGMGKEVTREQSPKPANAPGSKRQNLANTPAVAGETDKATKKSKAESVRSLPHKIEELSVQEEPAPLPATPATPRPLVKTTVLDGASVPSQPISASQMVRPRTVRESPSLGIENIDLTPESRIGYVAINSYTPARIYVDGQFSGLTPRTVKLTAGDHQIRLIAEGFEDWTRRVRLRGLQQVGLMAAMKKKDSQ